MGRFELLAVPALRVAGFDLLVVAAPGGRVPAAVAAEAGTTQDIALARARPAPGALTVLRGGRSGYARIAYLNTDGPPASDVVAPVAAAFGPAGPARIVLDVSDLPVAVAVARATAARFSAARVAVADPAGDLAAAFAAAGSPLDPAANDIALHEGERPRFVVTRSVTGEAPNPQPAPVRRIPQRAAAPRRDEGPSREEREFERRLGDAALRPAYDYAASGPAAEGDRIRHPALGIGVLLKRRGGRIDVLFRSGQATLKAVG